MASVSTKILKFLLLIGVTAYLFMTVESEAFSFDHFFFSLFMGGLAYLTATIFGFSLSISGNSLIAFIITAVVVIGGFLAIGEYQASHKWLSDDLLLIILGAVMILNIISDIFYIKVCLFPAASDNPSNDPAGE